MSNQKDQSGAELLKELKEKTKQTKNNQKENEMKNLKNKTATFGKTVLPWLILLALACGYVGYHYGVDRGMEAQKSISAEISAQVASKTSQK